MSSGGGRRKKKQQNTEEDEVEKLLRATEDDILLKLSVDSHISRGSSSQILDPDLDTRFRALRSSNSPKPPPNSKSNPTTSTDGSNLKLNQSSTAVNGDDDLLARFAALKSSLPSYSSAAANDNNKIEEIEDENDEDEVDKVIRWAMDAARLDPSPSSDADEQEVDSDSSYETDDSDEDTTTAASTKKKKTIQK